MGISGSDVAREAAAAVLLDDNFASIVVGIEQGRLIYDNLKKTIAYTLTHLWPEVAPVLFSLFFGLPPALTAIQILSIDLGTEMGPAISLAYENQERGIMKRKPRNIKKDRLVSRQLLVYAYLIVGVIEMIGCILAYLWVFYSHDIPISGIFFTSDKHWGAKDQTDICFDERCLSTSDQEDIVGEAASAWYITLIVCQLFHLVNCKTRFTPLRRHRMDNPMTLWGMSLTFCLMVIFVYVPGLQTIMGSRNANLAPWIIGVVFGLIITAFNEFRKRLMRKHPTSFWARELRW